MNKFFCILPGLIMLSALQTGRAQAPVIDGNNKPSHGVQLHFDPRLSLVINKRVPANNGNQSFVIRSGRGYRVQIYSGNDRAKATSTKIDFMRKFPGIPTYMTYMSPQFRVKVGDYRTRGEAHKMNQQVSELYNPTMIVPDIIVINTAKND